MKRGCDQQVSECVCNKRGILGNERIDVDEIERGVGGEDVELAGFTVETQNLTALRGQHNATEVLRLGGVPVIGAPNHLQFN